MNEPTTLPALALIGDNSTLLWGTTNAERLRRMARAEGLPDTPPATKSECPPAYFVRLYTTSSAPCLIGCCHKGPRKVLSMAMAGF